MIDDKKILQRSISYHHGYHDGYKEGFSEALGTLKKEYELAYASRPIRVEIPLKLTKGGNAEQKIKGLLQSAGFDMRINRFQFLKRLTGWFMFLNRSKEKREKVRRICKMEKLSTIQKRENLNKIYVVDEKGNGGANHSYLIDLTVDSAETVGVNTYILQFQDGPRKSQSSIHGVLDTDLLEIVRHRLQSFQKGDFATRENAVALTHIEEALLWMNKRVEEKN